MTTRSHATAVVSSGRFRSRFRRPSGSDAHIVLLGSAFALAGVAIGSIETAEHAVVATLAADEIRGSGSTARSDPELWKPRRLVVTLVSP